MIAYRIGKTAHRARACTLLVAGVGLAGVGCSSSSGGGGTGGSGGGGETDAAVDTAPTSCSGKAIALGANLPTNGDPAKSRVMVDFGAASGDGGTSELPIGNSPRTIELWAFVPGSAWHGDANTVFEYGATPPPTNGGFGLDFGGVAGTVDPYTNGSFDNDNQPSGLADYLTDQWVHFAMTYDQTAVTLYVNGSFAMGTQGARKTVANGVLNTVLTTLTIGGNPRGAYFNGYIDEFRVWNVARTQEEIMASMGHTLGGNEPGLVGYWKFDDGDGTVARDSVTSAGHTAHDGVLMATSSDMLPTWIDSTAPINCP